MKLMRVKNVAYCAVRGGSWFAYARDVCSAYRGALPPPRVRGTDLGFSHCFGEDTSCLNPNENFRGYFAIRRV